MNPQDKYAHIPGWGADLDHANRPAYPRERMPARLENPPEHPPTAQPARMEVLKSVEHPTRPPLFGTGPAPRGLSGSIRRWAFRFSESDLRHWLLLLFADRVNVGEGVMDDLARGHVPNIYAEMGGPAELRHNPMGAARKAVVVAAVLGLAYVALRGKEKREPRRLRHRLPR
jgi:hypothetical protein